MRKSFVGSGILTIVVGLSLALAAPTADYVTLDKRGDPLRTSFNADIGKVRVLMLVGPT